MFVAGNATNLKDHFTYSVRWSFFMLLKFAVQAFLDDRLFKNVTPKTLESYRIMIKQFEDFCLDRNVLNVEDITVNTVKQFILF